MSAARKLRLSNDLEYAILSALARGVVSFEIVSEEELSKFGRLTYTALRSLADSGAEAPFNFGAILLTAVDVLGAPRQEYRAYLANVHRAHVENDAAEILQKVRDKQLLVELINAAAEQLQKGALDVTLLRGMLDQEERKIEGAESVAVRIAAGLPDPPAGLSIKSLPRLTKASGGLYGMWAISGEPGIGKSALGWQLALDIAREIPAVYYDQENGFAVMMDRTRVLFEGDVERIRNATERIFYRESIRTLDRDLAIVPPPAVILVDSVQKLPAATAHRRDSLDKWVHRLELLKKQGYHIVLISEVPRAQYGQEASIASYKETGEIEYSADFGMQLLPGPGNVVEVHVVKNRHRPFRGFLTHMGRVRDWWWREADGRNEELD